MGTGATKQRAGPTPVGGTGLKTPRTVSLHTSRDGAGTRHPALLVLWQSDSKMFEGGAAPPALLKARQMVVTGCAKIASGNYAEALDLLTKGQKSIQSMGDELEAAACLYEQARCHFLSG
eukprot:Sspe_Gene.37209::Locus_17948_Transcript_1_2_Confidence_0.667_Length_496::g.37209::m.37209